MRSRLIVLAIGLLAAGAVVALLVNGGDDSANRTPAAYESQTVQAGEIDVVLQPHHVDATGAEIEVTLDTHSVDLGQDLVAGSLLRVGEQTWPTVRWSGDGPSGHHRTGTLSFESSGPATGRIVLSIAGFDEPVTATWEAER